MKRACGVYKRDDRHAFGTLAGISVLLLAVGVLAWPTVGFAADDTKFVRVDRVFGVNQPEMFVEDEFIVVFTRDARANTNVGQNRSGMPTINVPSLQNLIDENGVNRFARQFLTARARPAGSPYPDLTGHYKVKINAGVDLDTAMDAFARNPQVDHVEKIGIHPIHIDPNDPFYKDSPMPGFPYDQWSYFDRDTSEFPAEDFSVQADLAWEVETGDSSVVVAIADSGVRYFHSDLGGSDPPGPADNITNGNIWVNNGEIPGDGIDNDGNGFVDDMVGYDFVESVSGFCQCCDTDCGIKDNDPRDGNGHGTHLTGTVAAITNNDNRVAGVAGGFSAGSPTDAANGVKIMVLRIGWNAKCFGQCGYGFVRMDYAAEAMNYVADQVEFGGVNVAAFNASWGSSNSGGIDAATDNLLAHDVMIIHAAGNSNANSPGYLGNKLGVMNVAATDRDGNGASFTNFGTWVDLAAPGVDILSTWHHYPDPANDYIAVLSGTSMSAPHACGVAALLESCDATLSGPDKFNIMVANVRGYFDNRDLGSGILNAKLALDAAGCTAAPGCATNADCDDGNVCNGAETCLGGTCQDGTPLSCDDTNPCTDDDCVGGVCVYTDNAALCDDGDACTTGDTCSGGACIGGAPPNCDDGNVCTNDSCDPGAGCVNANNIAPCDDGDPCTGNPGPDGDTCTDGVCTGPPVDCSGQGDECNTASCNPNSADGNCDDLTPVADGTACGSGADTECDNPDSCLGGACQANNEPAGAACGDQGVACLVDDTCDGSGGCTDNGNQADGSSCGSGASSECDAADSCLGGACQDNNAAAGDPCGDQGVECLADDTCDGAGGCTDNGNQPDGSSCGSGASSECDAADSCLGGACQDNNAAAGTNCGDPGDTDCDNPDSCLEGACQDNNEPSGTACGDPAGTECSAPDSCDDAGNCDANDAADGTGCDDGAFCNGADSCGGGSCSQHAGNPCSEGETCDEMNDVCTAIGCQSDADCGDKDPCTDDACIDGVCVFTEIDCDDMDPCTDDSCVDGVCVNTPIICDDMDACTTDACVDGMCVFTDINCDDGNVCTDDSCDTGTGCVNANNTAACDDGNACTTADTCAAGACVGGADPNCDDGNVCTDDSCDPASGCVNANNTAACDDGDACTTSDTCAGGACVGGPAPNCDSGLFCDGVETCDPAAGCQAGTPVDCNDGVACTVDSCDEATDSCDNITDDGACDNGLFCDGAETCDAVLGCQAGSGPCDDGVACTVDICDEDFDICSNPPDDTLCDDGDPCTTDTCHTVDGCVNDPIEPAVCGDGCCDSAAGEDQCICPADCGDPPSTETECTDGVDNDCDGLTDTDDLDCCNPKGAPCTDDTDCCSNKCRGPADGKTCKGNA
ncbi:MAG: S8 family serine peptidase [Planctomycetes bacterium]|nr:S8 family serine peptidase [Planctomycetota bacterium]